MLLPSLASLHRHFWCDVRVCTIKLKCYIHSCLVKCATGERRDTSHRCTRPRCEKLFTRSTRLSVQEGSLNNHGRARRTQAVRVSFARRSFRCSAGVAFAVTSPTQSSPTRQARLAIPRFQRAAGSPGGASPIALVGSMGVNQRRWGCTVIRCTSSGPS